MIVFCDMDGVLVDLCGSLEQALTREGFDVLDTNSWYFEKWLPQTQAQEGKRFIWKLVKTEGFWFNLPPLEGAITGFRDLWYSDQIEELYITTTPWASYPESIVEKSEWIKKYLSFPTKSVIFIHNKSLLNGDILIDDKIENILNFQGYGLLYDQPWNRHVQIFYRMKNWNMINQFIQDRASKGPLAF